MTDPRDALNRALLDMLEWILSNMELTDHVTRIQIDHLKEIRTRIQAAERAIKGG